MPTKPFLLLCGLGVATLAAGSLLRCVRADARATVAPESVAQAIEGVWVYVGTPGHVQPVPTSGGRFKFRIDHRWTFTSVEPDARRAQINFGGTYRVNGNEYFETIDYSTDSEDRELGSTLKFTVKIDGDTMIQTGVGNPYTEVWRRLR